MTSFKNIGEKPVKHSFIDLLRRAVFICIVKIGSVAVLFRKIRFYYYTKCWPGHLGKRVIILRVANKVTIGKEASFYSNVVLEIGEDATLSIGKNFTISYGSVIVCNESVRIGDHVMIGEYTSIRDTSHSYRNDDLPFCKQTDHSLPIILGNNIWIGRGCMILPGTTIGNNVVVAANSVVKGILDADAVYAGSPAIKIKSL